MSSALLAGVLRRRDLVLAVPSSPQQAQSPAGIARMTTLIRVDLRVMVKVISSWAECDAQAIIFGGWICHGELLVADANIRDPVT